MLESSLTPRRMLFGCVCVPSPDPCADPFLRFVLFLSSRRVIPKTLMTPEVRPALSLRASLHLFRLHSSTCHGRAC
jgi:hypothetical protein